MSERETQQLAWAFVVWCYVLALLPLVAQAPGSIIRDAQCYEKNAAFANHPLNQGHMAQSRD